MLAINIVLGVAGIVGISGFTAALRYGRRLGRQNRLLRVSRGDQLQVVLTTSARGPGGEGVTYNRPTTAIGNLRAAVEIVQMAGHVSKSRPFSVAVSEDIESDLSGDLILIGLPGKNATSRRVIEALSLQHPQHGLEITESQAGVQLRLGDFFEDFKLSFQDGSELPERDLAVVLLWVNPFARGNKRRLLLCAGITAYGTAAAAGYVVKDLVDYRYKQLRSRHDLPSLLSPFRWACFAMIIEIFFQNDQAISVRERGFAPLPDPGSPPWA